MSAKLRIAIVGLGFGSHWVEAYARHPQVADVGICDANPVRLAETAAQYGVTRTHRSLEEVLDSSLYDAVHLFTGIPDHGSQTIRALEAGLHCACAIPMAITRTDVEGILRAQQRSGRRYMLMETECFSATYLYVKKLHAEGAFGEWQFFRAWHYQNMEGWPSYWDGLPPMYYAYHGLGPVLELAGRPVSRVQCLGSGARQPELSKQYGNSYPIETALFQFEGLDAICEDTVCLYKMARGFAVDRFSAYGDKMGFESTQYGGDPPVFFDVDQTPLVPGQGSRPIRGRRGVVPAHAELVPPLCRDYMGGVKESRFCPMVHEFVSSICDERPTSIDAPVAAAWTMAGLTAHESAMQQGQPMDIPKITQGVR